MTKTPSKSWAIRQIAKEDYSQSNKQIAHLVWNRYGLRVKGNAICGAIGSFRDRIKLHGYSKQLLERAKNFLNLVGELRICNQLLRIVAGQR